LSLGLEFIPHGGTQGYYYLTPGGVSDGASQLSLMPSATHAACRLPLASCFFTATQALFREPSFCVFILAQSGQMGWGQKKSGQGP